MSTETDYCEDDVFMLTDAGEAALEMNDQLRSIDGCLGIPRSSPSSAPPPEEPLA